MFKTKSRFNLLRIPQIFAILYIIILILISLDFSKDMSLVHYIINFILRMVPIILLMLFLYISIYHPYIGGLLFVIAGLGIVFFLQPYTSGTFLAAAIPILIIGIFFIVFGFLKNL